MTISRKESGRTFSLPKKQSFFPENEYCGRSEQHVAHVDFVSLGGKALHYIEVKSDAPVEILGKRDFICELRRKFICSMLLHSAVSNSRKENKSWPELLLENDAFSKPVRLALVITAPHFKKEWAAPLKDELDKTLKPYIRAYGLTSIVVWLPDDCRIQAGIPSRSENAR